MVPILSCDKPVIDVMKAQATIDCLISAGGVAMSTGLARAESARSLINSALIRFNVYAKVWATAAAWLYHDEQ